MSQRERREDQAEDAHDDQERVGKGRMKWSSKFTGCTGWNARSFHWRRHWRPAGRFKLVLRDVLLRVVKLGGLRLFRGRLSPVASRAGRGAAELGTAVGA